MEKTATTNNVVANATTYLSSDFHPSMLLPSGTGEASRSSSHSGRPRKRKRAKLARNTSAGGADSTPRAHPNPNKTTRRPDPSAPKITRPCTECGRKFWSWKALFGHMRCHPEREWRGIDPPPGFRGPEAAEDCGPSISVSDEDHEVAACLLMLAGGGGLLLASDSAATSTSDHFAIPGPEYSEDCYQSGVIRGHFECSSCRKVFGSPQALGGHRASHKNVKGCFAITKSSIDGEELEGCCWVDNQIVSSKENNDNTNNNGYKCSVCFRVFSSGQALGGHMRCHWEKVEEPTSRVFGFDLNLAAPVEDDDEVDNGDFACSLDLRLGL